MHMAPSFVRRAGAALFLLGLLAGGMGCAAGTAELKTPRYTLSHPAFWKVNTVAQKDGDPTRITIGKFSETITTNPSDDPNLTKTQESVNETSQADVDVWIYAWPVSVSEAIVAAPGTDPAAAGDPALKVATLLKDQPDLGITKLGRMPTQPPECGEDFRRKFKILGNDRPTLDLGSRPGHRMIVVGTESDGMLLGVISRVPVEPDPNLYCHNLNNMRIQLQNVLDGLRLLPGGAKAASTGAPPPPS
jgi:hypothetical protein